MEDPIRQNLVTETNLRVGSKINKERKKKENTLNQLRAFLLLLFVVERERQQPKSHVETIKTLLVLLKRNRRTIVGCGWLEMCSVVKRNKAAERRVSSAKELVQVIAD